MKLEEAFLADIVEHPNDDSPRLVFADWLEENGNTQRAEFIRIQCQLARLAAHDPNRAALERQEAVLLSRHQQHWMVDVAACCVSWPGFQRGFIEAVDCSAGVFVERAERLFSQAPVRDLTLYDVVPYLGELSRCAGLARLSTLRLVVSDTEPLGGVLPLRAFASLCVSAHLYNLRVLDLAGCGIGATGARLLTFRHSLPGLLELGLASNDLEDNGVMAIADSGYPASLEGLDLRDNHISDRGTEALANSPHRRNLRWLRLEGNDIRDRGIEALLDSPTLPRLMYLLCDQQRLRADLRDRLRERCGGRSPIC